jgi:hypothetical protein
MRAKEYLEALAQELSRAGGRGLILSPADAQLALAWHAGGVPLKTVIAALRALARKRPQAERRRSLPPPLSLQALAASISVRASARPHKRPASDLRTALIASARTPSLAAREAWRSLAEDADDLLAHDGGDSYWSAAVRALKLSLRELPRAGALQAGEALRARMAPRPKSMPRRRYQRSLQLMLLSASSERLGLPPRAFLL